MHTFQIKIRLSLSIFFWRGGGGEEVKHFIPVIFFMCVFQANANNNVIDVDFSFLASMLYPSVGRQRLAFDDIGL